MKKLIAIAILSVSSITAHAETVGDVCNVVTIGSAHAGELDKQKGIDNQDVFSQMIANKIGGMGYPDYIQFSAKWLAANTYNVGHSNYDVGATNALLDQFYQTCVNGGLGYQMAQYNNAPDY